MPKVSNVEVFGLERSIKEAKYAKAIDINTLSSELTQGIKNCATAPTGSGHDNFLKGILVRFDLTFSNKAWVEAERYHWFDIVTSQSTMHKITKFDIKKSCNKYVFASTINQLEAKISEYNRISSLPIESSEIMAKRKEALDLLFLEIIYNIPSGFELTAGMSTNYLELKTMYQQRRHHRLPDWQMFCDWCETLPMFMELTQKEKMNESKD